MFHFTRLCSYSPANKNIGPLSLSIKTSNTCVGTGLTASVQQTYFIFTTNTLYFLLNALSTIYSIKSIKINQFSNTVKPEGKGCCTIRSET